MIPPDLEALAGTVIAAARSAGLRLVTAESCTGGLIAGCLTAVPGASQVFERGFVTYSNQAKSEAIGVPAALIAAHGAVSPECAAAMARGALAHARAGLALAVTGIAGPGGGSPGRPVGLVYLAVGLAGGGEPRVERQVFPGDRAAVRLATVRRGLELLAAAAGCGNDAQCRP